MSINSSPEAQVQFGYASPHVNALKKMNILECLSQILYLNQGEMHRLDLKRDCSCSKGEEWVNIPSQSCKSLIGVLAAKPLKKIFSVHICEHICSQI